MKIYANKRNKSLKI